MAKHIFATKNQDTSSKNVHDVKCTQSCVHEKLDRLMPHPAVFASFWPARFAWKTLLETEISKSSKIHENQASLLECFLSLNGLGSNALHSNALHAIFAAAALLLT